MTDAGETLSLRALSRATLARQGLLARERIAIPEALERFGAVQAQEPRPPFAALWSRLEAFEPGDVRAALSSGEAVRATTMRATLHLLSAGDYAALRPALEPVMEAAMRGALKGRLEGLDLGRVLPAARALLDERPRTFEELRDALAEAFPEADKRALGYAVRTRMELVMVPTDDRWGFPRAAQFRPAEDLDAGAGARAVVLRHLAAFGPATVADVQTWSGLGGLRDVVDALRPDLEVLRDERGRELFDLPGAPRPGEDTPAPARLLAPFDSLVLAHKDRTRIIADEHRPRMATRNLRIPATFLLDGFVAGTWTSERKGKKATLRLSPFGRLAKADRAALTEEAGALLRLLEEDASTFAVEVAKD